MITTRYTAYEGAVVEFVTELSDGDIALTVNVLPIAPPPPLPPSEESSPETTLAAAPLTKKRLLPALIRGTYAVIFALLGAAATALVYLEGVLGSLSLPPWVAAAVGIAVTFLGYFLKKFIKPDGLL